MRALGVGGMGFCIWDKRFKACGSGLGASGVGSGATSRFQSLRLAAPPENRKVFEFSVRAIKKPYKRGVRI